MGGGRGGAYLLFTFRVGKEVPVLIYVVLPGQLCGTQVLVMGSSLSPLTVQPSSPIVLKT